MIRPYLESIIFVIASLLLLSTITGCITDLDPRMSSSTHQYSINIQSDKPLENATFIIPIPIKNNTPMLGSNVFIVEDFQKEKIDIELIQFPAGLDLTTVPQIEGYTPWFVVIHADRFIPDQTTLTIYQMKKNIRIEQQKPNFSIINTLHPIGNESLIVPKYNFSWQEPYVDRIQAANIRYAPNSIPEKTMIYSDYQTSASTRVSIAFSLEGRNTWKQGYDDWIGNTYSEFFSKHFTGPQTGWFLINGEMKLQDGFYPNPNNPEWQEVLGINQTQA